MAAAEHARRIGDTVTQTEVRCYSGHTYAERPVAFRWGGEEVAVDEVLATWREPAGPVFRVRTRRGVFQLSYDEGDARWSVSATP